MSLQTKMFLQTFTAAAALVACVGVGLVLSNNFNIPILVASGAVGLLVTLVASVSVLRITKDLVSLQETIAEAKQGNFEIRSGISKSGAVGDLAISLDTFIVNYCEELNQCRQENDQMRESIGGLVNSVAELRSKDLTVVVPISNDITGPIAESLNSLTTETGTVMREVCMISELVAHASAYVKDNSDKVIELANEEREEVDVVLQQISESSSAMNEIANEAKSASSMADSVMQTTSKALGTVVKTTEGIDEIRVTISETEKRIKRLGERSQEITGIVNLINSIAERTHVLALNASMHAASAGEAGRGFAVVADEVQRLAENARQATTEISTLVNNIRVETADTVNIMNKVIGQVAEGTNLANQAGEKMEQTQSSMSELVAFVQKITSYSGDIVKRSEVLESHAKRIRSTTSNTGKQLVQQASQTEALTSYSNQLLQAVGSFKLPEAEVQPKVLQGAARLHANVATLQSKQIA